MDTQPQYIKIALFIGLGLLVLITCIGSYMLYTMEYDEPTSVSVPANEVTQTQNQATPPMPEGMELVMQEGTEDASLPPPLVLPEGIPSLEEMQARQAAHEEELKAVKENPSTPVVDFITQEEIQRRTQELQNTPPTTPQ